MLLWLEATVQEKPLSLNMAYNLAFFFCLPSSGNFGKHLLLAEEGFTSENGKALEGGEGPFEGAGRLFKVNPRVLCAEEGDDWGQHKFRFFGRPPAAQPGYAEALKALRGFIEPFRHVLNPLLVGLVGERRDENCSYTSLTLYWTVILGFFQHLRSRHQMDARRNYHVLMQIAYVLWQVFDTGVLSRLAEGCRKRPPPPCRGGKGAACRESRLVECDCIKHCPR